MINSKQQVKQLDFNEAGLVRIASAVALIILFDDGRKVAIISPFVVARPAVRDPELKLGLPPQLTAATGMDAIAHCMETLMSAAFNPLVNDIVLDSLRRIWTHIEMVLHRSTQRGRANEHDLARMAASMGSAPGADVARAVADLTQRLGLPAHLGALGIERALFDRIMSVPLLDVATRPIRAKQAVTITGARWKNHSGARLIGAAPCAGGRESDILSNEPALEPSR
jgi:alcohol dehydrogenase class IV